MSKFEEVTEKYSEVKWMDAKRAGYIRDFIKNNNIDNILEIGFLNGKSSAYFGAIQEDRGQGSVTTIDLEGARDLKPNIFDLISELKIEHRVKPIFTHRSFTWELARMIASEPRPQFDFCYLDAGKTWDTEGFGFFLADMLLKPGGFILFDDIYWSLEDSDQYKNSPETYAHYDKDEIQSQSIKLIWEKMVPHLGYAQIGLIEQFQWGLAQKPMQAAGAGVAPAPVIVSGGNSSIEQLFWRTGRSAKKRLKRLL